MSPPPNGRGSIPSRHIPQNTLKRPPPPVHTPSSLIDKLLRCIKLVSRSANHARRAERLSGQFRDAPKAKLAAEEKEVERMRMRRRIGFRDGAHRKRCFLISISPFHGKRLYQNVCRVTAACQLGMRPNHVRIGRNAKRRDRWRVWWWHASFGLQGLGIPGIPNVNSLSVPKIRKRCPNRFAYQL